MEATVRTLRSVYITARKQHLCDLCLEPIAKGERYSRYVGVDGSELVTSACHIECVALMDGCDDDTDWYPEYFREILEETRQRHPERLTGRWEARP
jgi:hypothetical protein